MKREFTKQDIVTLIKGFDKRAERLSDETIDNIIDMGFAELAAVTHLFSNEEIIPLDPYYTSGETVFIIDIEEDVVGIYELYLTIEGLSTELYHLGIKQVMDPNCIYTDERYNGRVHVNLDNTTESTPFDNCVVKYFYTPAASDESFFMDQQTYLAVINGMGAALYDNLHDVERASQKRAATHRTAMAVIPNNPNDLEEPKPSMFPKGV